MPRHERLIFLTGFRCTSFEDCCPDAVELVCRLNQKPLCKSLKRCWYDAIQCLDTPPSPPLPPSPSLPPVPPASCKGLCGGPPRDFLSFFLQEPSSSTAQTVLVDLHGCFCDNLCACVFLGLNRPCSSVNVGHTCSYSHRCTLLNDCCRDAVELVWTELRLK